MANVTGPNPPKPKIELSGGQRFLISDTAKAIVHQDGDKIDAVCVGPLHGPLAKELVRRGNAHDVLILGLRQARDAYYNPFEPDNQGALYHALDALLEEHDAEYFPKGPESSGPVAEGADRPEAQQP